MGEDNLTLLTAFAAGVVSFLSPCVLPLLPTYTAVLAGTGTQTGRISQWRFLMNAACFFSGFIIIFVAMGATASYFGQVFFKYQDIVRKVGAVFMILMGIHLAGLIRLPALYREYRPLLSGAFEGPLGAFILGIAFTAGWTPCTGPILASILIYAGASATVAQGAFLLFIYAIGFCLPFIVLALLFNRYLHKVRRLYQWLPAIQRAAGVILIIVGCFIYFDWLQKGLGFIWNLL